MRTFVKCRVRIPALRKALHVRYQARWLVHISVRRYAARLTRLRRWSGVQPGSCEVLSVLVKPVYTVANFARQPDATKRLVWSEIAYARFEGYALSPN
jgi:hypothetical protein